jgi:MFS family permease
MKQYVSEVSSSGRRRGGRPAAPPERLPGPLRWLIVGTLVNAAGTFVLPFLALYLIRARHVDVGRVGLVLAMFGVGSVSAALVAGRIGDHLGHRRTAAAAACLTAVSAASLAVITTLPGLAAIVAVYGFALNAVNPPRQALVAELAVGALRPRAYAWLAWGRACGGVAAPLIGGALATHSFPALFAADAATTLVLGLVIALRVPQTGRAARAGPSPPALHTVRLPREIVAVVTLNGVFALVLMQQTATLPLLVSLAGFGPATFGIASAAGAAIVVVLQVPAARVLSRQDPDRTVAVATLVAGIGALGVCAVDSVAGFILAAAVWSIGDVGREPFVPARIAGLAPAGGQGRAQGALQLSYSLARLLGPPLGTAALATGGRFLLAVGCTVATLLAGLGQLTLGRTRLVRSPTPPLSARRAGSPRAPDDPS